MALCACRIGFDEIPNDGSASDGAFTTITFGERPTSQRKNVTRDTTLSGGMVSENNGDLEDLSISDFGAPQMEHALLRFDLASVPSGTPIVGARLSLARIDYGDEAPGMIEVRVVSESWTEGTGTPGSGAAWNTRDGTTAWATAGGTTGQTLAMLTPPAVTFDISIAPAVVQTWIDTSATNDGLWFAVRAVNVHYHFHSANSVMTSLRPELVIDLAQ